MKYTVIDTYEVTYILGNTTEEEIQAKVDKMRDFVKEHLDADDVVHTRHRVIVHDEEASK